MTNWGAVLVGFVVMLVLGAIGIELPIVGQIAAGLIGGFVAGFMAGGGIAAGAWHGLLAGSIAGIALTALLAVAASLIGLGFGPLGAFLGGAGVFVIGVVITFLFAIDSLIGGAVGGLLA